MRSMLVIGLGRFGRHLATRLAELGNEVMVVDANEAAVNGVASKVTTAEIGDCMDPEVIRSIGVRNFDVCFVCISDNFQSSLEITSLLKEAGARMVVSKTDREMHAKFLLKIGADAVIHPERDMAWRTAMRYSAEDVFDYIELTPEYSIFEMKVPREWVGHTLAELKIRTRYNVNVIGVKVDQHVTPVLHADHAFTNDEHILLAGSRKDILRLVDR